MKRLHRWARAAWTALFGPTTEEERIFAQWW